MHRQQLNGMAMPNGTANGGPRPMPNGMPNGAAAHGLPNGAPIGAAKALPSSPPQAPLKQLVNGTANGFVVPKALPNSPPMAPPKQLPNSPPPMAPAKQLPNGNASARPLPTTVPNGVRAPPHSQTPNGTAIPNSYMSPSSMAHPGPPLSQHYQHNQPLPLPPGAAHRSAPIPALASPPTSPRADPSAFPQQMYSRPPMFNANGNAGVAGLTQQPKPQPLPQHTEVPPPRALAASPPQHHAQLNGGPRNMPSPPMTGPPVANHFASRTIRSPPMEHQQLPVRSSASTSPPSVQNGLVNTTAPPPQFNRGHRAAPAPPSMNTEALNALNGNASSMASRPARSTSVGQRNAPMSPPNVGRQLPNEPSNSPAAWPSTASGATVHVIASSDPRRVAASTPPVAPSPSSTTLANIAPAGNTASRPKITIPSHSTSPPPRAQPYTAPVLAAATAATTPDGAKGVVSAQARQHPRRQPSDLMSPIEFTPSSTTVPEGRDAKALSHGSVGNGIPPAPAAALAGSQLPPRTRSSAIQARRIVSSPLASPAVSVPSSPTTHTSAASGSRSVSAGTVMSSRFPRRSNSPTASAQSSPSTARASSVMDRPRPQAKHKSEKTITYLFTHPRITMALLPFLNINSFLNLLGSDDELRKYISGEMVGRWVMREWGITIERERGRSWPGLTVWEGFREYTRIRQGLTNSRVSPARSRCLQHVPWSIPQPPTTPQPVALAHRLVPAYAPSLCVPVRAPLTLRRRPAAAAPTQVKLGRKLPQHGRTSSRITARFSRWKLRWLGRWRWHEDAAPRACHRGCHA